MSISASEASRLTGKSKQTVINAINAGKISAVKDVDGVWQIEPVELFRHFQPASNLNGNGHPALDAPLGQLDAARQPLDDTYLTELISLREKVSMMERIIRDKDDVIGDLRRRLDEMTEVNTKYAAVIAQLAPPQPRKGWWQRLLGGA
jgi:hypothetical protein